VFERDKITKEKRKKKKERKKVRIESND
jgi:hypothetical protein